MVNGRLYIPVGLRGIVLESLHAAHQVVSGINSAARGRFFWPGMDQGISQTHAQCKRCNERAPSQSSEEWIEEDEPTFAFEIICMDYFQNQGGYYLTQADS